MFREVKKHMPAPKDDIPEDYKLTHEAKFTHPTLEQKYWANPNAQRGEVARCSYAHGGVHTEVRSSEGV